MTSQNRLEPQSEDRIRLAQELHQRLLQGDPVAPSELAEEFLGELVRRLGARARTLRVPADSMILDAATDALISYIQEPRRFDPARSGLMTYLTMSAYGDLLNALAREGRRVGREVPYDDVEQSLDSGNNVAEGLEEDPFQHYGIFTKEARNAFWSRIAQEFPDPQDLLVLGMILEGERRTTAYSQVLGIGHLDQGEQRRIVKRHKDRINKRLQRLGGKISEPR